MEMPESIRASASRGMGLLDRPFRHLPSHSHPPKLKKVPSVHSQISFRPFTTSLNHKVQLYVSPVPDQQTWKIDALNINWLGLIAYAYPTMALLQRVIQKICQCKCLIILIAQGWPGMFLELMQLSTKILLQLTVS